MLHNAAFHQGLHYLLRQIQFLKKEILTQYIQWTILILLYLAFWKIPFVLKWLKQWNILSIRCGYAI